MVGRLKRLLGAGEHPQRPLFAAVAGEARRPSWYRSAGVPDTLEGRFALLATVCALVILRLEASGGEARRAAIGLTECFVDEMDGEVRQMGIGDPTVARQVGAMVGALGGRVGRLRRLEPGSGEWDEEVSRAIHRGATVDPDARAAALAAIAALHAALASAGDRAVSDGRWR